MEHKGYYAIIPASVRYDRSIPHGAKLLYGEITALCNEKGFCWASNEYFAGLYQVSKTTVTNWINALIENGYVIRNIRYKDGSKEIDGRCLTIIEEVHKKTCRPSPRKFADPPQENLRDNNTFNNTTNNICAFFENLWELYPIKRGKGSVSKTQKEKLFKIGIDEMARAINRYITEQQANGTDIKYYKQGSTFFNSGYVDYLDENYAPITDEKQKTQTIEDLWGEFNAEQS